MTRVYTPDINPPNETDWSPPVSTKPKVDIVANVGTQSIDVVVTGRAATTINWYLDSESLQNLS